MTDPDIESHLVDLKYLLVALLFAVVAAEAVASGRDGNAGAVVLAAALAVAPVGLAYFVTTSTVTPAENAASGGDDGADGPADESREPAEG
ncbi:hypothetical protein [Halobaculum litoreum]|uniref:Uncharacterized protein n=1 Tax=Halobaculum litoreum TaxID=3031998 RepID=A0ABD5XKN2_9EURY|nr:hypothetical protein [Halobaculum sp. DT92]